MAEQERDRLLDHEYDGIREYDNPCPAWWHSIFLGSVLFAAAYFVFFHIGLQGWTTTDAHEAAVARSLQQRFAEIGELQPTEATLTEYMGKPDWLAVGVAVYKTHCKSCHGAEGNGLVGPNLTDETYKNVKSLVEVATVVEEGAANGSMPAWRARLHPNEIVLVSAYVASLRGKNIPGRPAEGQPIPPWPTSPAATEGDSKPDAAGPADNPPGESAASSPAETTS
jgi:cytochrome c oxidase cbb3-type subunit 3